MTDFITVTGTVGTDPEHKVVGEDLSRTTFRLACSERRRSADGQSWEDTHTNWYSVTTFGRLATNVGVSIKKGQRIMVNGKLRIRTYAREDGSQGTQVEIIASSVGHDLSFQAASAAKRANAERTDAAPAEAATPSETAGWPAPLEGEAASTPFGVAVDAQTGEVTAIEAMAGETVEAPF